jgi:phospholipase/lecithinase/hemolysin
MGMKKLILTLGILMFSLVLPNRTLAATFSKLFVFGDSLSDTGNIFNITRNFGSRFTIPQSPPFFQGRFSNGPMWVDYFGDSIGLKPSLSTSLTSNNQGINFSFGGSNTDNNAFVPFIPGMRRQVELFTQPFLNSNEKLDSNGIYVLWTGTTDYIVSGVTDVDKVVQNISNSVSLLTQAGAKNVLVFNLPDLGKTPDAAAKGSSSTFTDLASRHNQTLATALNNFRSQPNINVVPVDISSRFNQLLANPGELGIKNTTDACVIATGFLDLNIQSVCNNPNDFLFFDDVHPTTLVHRLISETALTALNSSLTNNSLTAQSALLASKPASVPEVSTVLYLLPIGWLIFFTANNSRYRKRL